MNLYKVLGVDEKATHDEIKAAYKKRAQETHPDKTGGGDAEFQNVAHAFSILSDERKRKDYDETGREQFDAQEYVEPHVSLVLNIFAQAIDKCAQVRRLDEDVNPFEFAKHELREQRKEGEQTLREGTKRKVYLEQLLKTLKKKRRKTLLPYRSLVEGSLRMLQRRIDEVEQRLETCIAAQEFLAGAKWEDLFAVEREVEDTQRIEGHNYTITERTARPTTGA
jgi:curved DNA-binding protein CbpA